MEQIAICVGEKTFTANIYESELSNSFLKELPLSLHLERDERDYFSPLKEKLFGRAEKASTVVRGDIAICNSISVSIFLETISTDSNFSKLGHVRNPDELIRAIRENKGNVTFKFLPVNLEAIA